MVGDQHAAPYEFIVVPAEDLLTQDLAKYWKGSYLEYVQGLLSPEVRSRVVFVDPLPQAELRKVYQNADLFIFPSVWNEPFGMPVLEAMACGLPVVTTRGGGIPEFVDHGKSGLLVERGDSKALAEAVCALLRDGELRRKMGRAAREKIEGTHSWDHIAQQLHSRLASLVQPRSQVLGP